MPIRFIITPAMRERANRVGDGRHRFHVERGTPGSFGAPAPRDNPVLRSRLDRVGAMGELVLAMAFGVEDEWVEVTKDFKKLLGDVLPGVEARGTDFRGPDPHLILHPQDYDKRTYTLVQDLGTVAIVYGWMYGREGKLAGYWPGDDPKRPCYWIPWKHTHPDLVTEGVRAKLAEAANAE